MQEDIQEQPTEEVVEETTPDLSDVEIRSNGTFVDTEDNKEEEAAEEKQPKEAEPPAEEKELQKAKAEQESVKETLKSQDIDYGKLEAEYLEKGELSEESYKLLQDKGYDKALVDMVIAGWQAKADSFVNAVIKDAGGKTEYDKIQRFIKTQGEEAVRAFNDIVESSSLGTIKMYINGIKAQMVSKFGTSNPTLTGTASGGNTKSFNSIDEITKAMSDPRYGKDAAYMAEIEQRMSKSKIFG